jgi:hypothetical protein
MTDPLEGYGREKSWLLQWSPRSLEELREIRKITG